MAFLHRVINGGGTMEREYAIGRGRMDLCLRLGAVTVAMELKVWREGRADPLPAGLAQLDGYLDGLGLTTGWLVIFDERPGAGPAAVRTPPRGRTLARRPRAHGRLRLISPCARGAGRSSPRC
jgi:hypothetical protein